MCNPHGKASSSWCNGLVITFTLTPNKTRGVQVFNGLVGSWGDDLSSDSADQFTQFEEIFHSPVREWCMVFKLWRLLPSSLSDLGDSLSKPNLFPQLGERAIVLGLFPNIVQHVHFPFFHCFEDRVPIVSSTSWENWVSSCAIRATQSESYDMQVVFYIPHCHGTMP